MLFRKKIEKACAYCLFACILDEENAVCKKHGVVDLWDKCSAFQYDPLKREPEADTGELFSDFSEEDFLI